jgi:hypothetical protein
MQFHKAPNYHTARNHIPGDHNLHIHCHENFKTCTMIYISIITSFRTAILRCHCPCYIFIKPCLHNTRWFYTIISWKSVHSFASINLQHSYKLVALSTSPVSGHIQGHKNEKLPKIFGVFSNDTVSPQPTVNNMNTKK